MAYYKIDTKKFARMRREAQQFQDDIVCAVGTDFMRNIAESENRMIFDILNGVESESTADVVEVVRCEDCQHYDTYYHQCTKSEHFIKMKCTDFCSYGKRRDT